MIGSLTKNKKFFEIEKDIDGYYVVKVKKNPLVYTAKEEHAQEIIRNISDLYNWKKFKNIQWLYKKDKKSYEKIAAHLRKYAVERKFNGNYKESFNDGYVEYRIDKHSSSKVIGKEIENGVALRKTPEGTAVDCILAGETLGVFIDNFDTEEKTKLFVNELKKYFVLNNGELMKIVFSSKSARDYINKLAKHIDNKGEIIHPPQDEMLKIQFRMYGGEDQEREKVFVNSFKKLNNLVGLKNVKQQLDIFLKTVSTDKKLKSMNLTVKQAPLHSLFIGNAGTGKTEVARLFADLLWSIGLIKEKKLIEISKEDLVSKYVGGTEENTQKKISEAIGGVLFVDEAYMLAENSGNDNNGKIALEMIMRAMENYKENFVVIFAGYEEEIETLLNTNQGLRSRFAHRFIFEDYDDDELTEIALRMFESQRFNARPVANEILTVIKKKRKMGEITGNARSIRKIVDRITENHKVEITYGGHNFNISPQSVLRVIGEHKDDGEQTQENLKRAEEKLFSLVGLKELKQEIKTWSNYILIEKKRFERGMVKEKPTLHMTFEGNPGTGKTTVARIIGEILRYNGLLSKGHFIEASRAELVGKYMGHTAIKVKELVKEALGGILFIDEAYSLVQGENDNFGKEAVDTLIAEAENNKDDLVIILAGYTNEIEKLLDSNPGFKSRIAKRFVFPDYSTEELYQLFELRMKNYQFVMTNEAKQFMKQYIFNKKEANEVDGNGRWVRNLVDKIKMNQANRLVKENSDDLETIVLADVQTID